MKVSRFPEPRVVEILSLKPGDTIVLEYDKPLRPEDVAYITEVMKRQYPDHKTLVLESLHLKVIRNEA